MKRSSTACSVLALLLALGASVTARADDPVLEAYTISHGGNVGGRAAGVRAFLVDRFLGNGRARARIDLQTFPGGNRLVLRVSRTLPEGARAPALRVTRVQVVGLDAAGTAVYSEEPGNFSFGDNQSGRQVFVIKDIPSTAKTFQVRFFGAYE